MIAIRLDPILATLGPFVISWHGLFTAIGVLAGVLITARLAHGTAVTVDDVYAVAMPVVLGGIVGARLLFVVKEAVYKAVFPLEGAFLEHHDVEVDLNTETASVRGGRTISFRHCVAGHFVAIAFVAR